MHIISQIKFTIHLLLTIQWKETFSDLPLPKVDAVDKQDEERSCPWSSRQDQLHLTSHLPKFHGFCTHWYQSNTCTATSVPVLSMTRGLAAVAAAVAVVAGYGDRRMRHYQRYMAVRRWIRADRPASAEICSSTSEILHNKKSLLYERFANTMKTWCFYHSFIKCKCSKFSILCVWQRLFLASKDESSRCFMNLPNSSANKCWTQCQLCSKPCENVGSGFQFKRKSRSM